MITLDEQQAAFEAWYAALFSVANNPPHQLHPKHGEALRDALQEWHDNIIAPSISGKYMPLLRYGWEVDDK